MKELGEVALKCFLKFPYLKPHTATAQNHISPAAESLDVINDDNKSMLDVLYARSEIGKISCLYKSIIEKDDPSLRSKKSQAMILEILTQIKLLSEKVMLNHDMVPIFIACINLTSQITADISKYGMQKKVVQLNY